MSKLKVQWKKIRGQGKKPVGDLSVNMSAMPAPAPSGVSVNHLVSTGSYAHLQAWTSSASSYSMMMSGQFGTIMPNPSFGVTPEPAPVPPVRRMKDLIDLRPGDRRITLDED